MFLILCAAASLIAAMDMTPQEMTQTGMSKLSPGEKSALQNWIDKNYTKKSMAQAPQKMQKSSPNKKQPGPTLQENLRNGHNIRLSDGTLWEINPSDTPITQGWITAVEIKVESSGDSVYPYKLTNTLTGSSVRARKASTMPQNAPGAPTPSGMKK